MDTVIIGGLTAWALVVAALSALVAFFLGYALAWSDDKRRREYLNQRLFEMGLRLADEIRRREDAVEALDEVMGLRK